MKPKSPFAYAPSLEASASVMLDAWTDLATGVAMELNDYSARTGHRVLTFVLSFDTHTELDPVTRKVKTIHTYRANPVVCKP